MAPPPLFFGSDIYRGSSYGPGHPLRVPRVSTVIDLSRALGWLPDALYRDSAPAAPALLERFHTSAYVAALQRAEAEQHVDAATTARHGLGTIANPVFAEMYRRPATAAAASVAAARAVLAGGRAFSPAGGTHHGQPDRAAGFCYVNDPVLAILALRDAGLRRIAYVDLDAHHGDGVEAAFAGVPEVLTLSLHEARRWPFTGDVPVAGKGSIRNLAVPAGFNDSELAFLMDEVVLPLVAAHLPEALVVQCGADALADDPMSRLALSNGALAGAVLDLAALCPRFLVLGGGGYNPWSVGRAWTLLWGLLCGHAPPYGPLPDEARAVLEGLSWSHRRGRDPDPLWRTTLHDAPAPGAVREEVRALARAHGMAGAERKFSLP